MSRWMIYLRALLLTLIMILTTSAVLAQSGDPAFRECERAVDEESLRAEIAKGARGAMRAAAQSVDYQDLVESSWLAIRFDAKFARIIDAKIAVLREDRAYLERLLDGNIPSRAGEMAIRSTEAVFQSPEFEALQLELQSEIGARLEPLVVGTEVEMRSRAADCVGIFLGERYAATVGEAFSADTREAIINPNVDIVGAETSAAFSLAGVLAGMLAIVFRRIIRRIIQATIRRLAGAIAGRLLAMASIVLGVVILVYELVAGADGVFPIIRDALLSRETKVEIQTALADEIGRVAPEALDKRADLIADQMIGFWRRFKSRHRSVLELADQSQHFKRFIEDQPPSGFEPLSIVVEALKSQPPGGEQAVLDALDRGILNRAMQIPQIGRLIERFGPAGVTVEALVAWSRRAGLRFADVVAADLPLLIKPETLSHADLGRILALADPQTAKRLVVMPQPALGEALALPEKQLLALTARFQGDELTGLFDSLRPATTAQARSIYVRRILDNPSMIKHLKFASGAVAASAEPALALEILLSTTANWNPLAVLDHVQAVANARVAPMVMVHRYGWGLVITIGIPLLIGLWFVRLVLRLLGISGRRHT